MRSFFGKIKALFTKSETEKTSLQKTARIAIIFFGVAIVGLIVYFAVIAPFVHSATHFTPELYEGEEYIGGNLYILRLYERDEMVSIEIKNETEHYTLKTIKDKNGDTQFQIVGHEDMSLSPQQVSLFITDARNLLTNSPAGQLRVTETATEEDLRNYGLDEASDPSWFEVKLLDGSSYRIRIGNPLTTTVGYYVMLEGRKNVVDGVEYDIIYALRSSLGETILGPSAQLINPELAPFDSNVYTMTLFGMEKLKGDKREPVVTISMVEDQGISASSQVFKLIYPASYVINEDTYGEYVLTNLAYVTATEIVAYGPSVYTPEVYEKYGLDLDEGRLESETDLTPSRIYYSTKDPDDENFTDSLIVLYFSDKQTELDGTEFYYVFSPMYETIGKISAEKLPFLEWSVAQFTNPYLFFEYFTSCESIELHCTRENMDYRFTLAGKERNRSLTVTKTDGTPVYTKNDAGETVPMIYEAKYKEAATGIEFYGDFERFRDLYYVLITRQLALYAEVDESITAIGDSFANLSIKVSPKDRPITYYTYVNGQSDKQVRDEGGNILCREVLVPTTLSDGTVKDLSYNRAFYDEATGRFFLKIDDSNDGNTKPAGFEVTEDGTVKVNTFLPMTAYGEYDETIYGFTFYDLYDEYTDYDGNTARTLNSTYKYVVPSTTTNTYKLTSGGEKELLSSVTEVAEVGVYIRTSTLDKLFSDTDKFLTGKPIDKMALN